MSLYTEFITKVFGGHDMCWNRIETNAGVPTHNAEHKGIICYDTTNKDYYIATDAVGTWVKMNA